MKIFLHSVLIGFIVLSHAALAQTIVTYPGPSGETASPDYQVSVNGHPVFCYSTYAANSAGPLTVMGQPVSPVTFCSFDFSGTVSVTVTFGSSLASAGINTSVVTVRPLANGLAPTVASNTITFPLTHPAQLSIEPGNQTNRPLHLFANPLEVTPPLPTDAGVQVLNPGVHTTADTTLLAGKTVLYFMPGTHQVPSITPIKGETIYIAGGAVVELAPLAGATYNDGPHYGYTFAGVPALIQSNYINNVTVRGRGILSTRVALQNLQRADIVEENSSNYFTMEGVTLREPGGFNVNLDQGTNAHVENIKILGHYINSDCIAVATSNTVVQDTFCHTADDNFEIQNWHPQSNVTFDNDISWSNEGINFGITQAVTSTISNVLYVHDTSIHDLAQDTAEPSIGMSITHQGTSVSGITFQNIVIEDTEGPVIAPIKVVNNWLTGAWQMTNVKTQPGNPYVLLNPPSDVGIPPISNVTFNDVKVLSSSNSDIAVVSAGSDAPISGVNFNNVSIKGTPITSGYQHFYTDTSVSGVTYSTTIATIPPAPVASAATAVSSTGFTANWSASPTATGYYLDISTSSSFATFIFVGQNISVGNVTSYVVAGLKPGITYYYRVRASNSAGVSGNSNSETTTDLAGFLLTPSTTQTIAAGSLATYTVAATPNPAPFNYTVIFSCDSGLPEGVACSSFSPNSVTPGNTGATTTLTVSTTSRSTVSGQAAPEPLARATPVISIAAINVWIAAFCGIAFFRKRKGFRLLNVLLLFSLAFATGCSTGGSTSLSSSSNPNGTPAGTYAITVLATGNDITQTTAVTLIVK